MTRGHLQKKGEKIPIEIPDSWEDITLGKFIDVYGEEELKDSQMFAKLTGIDESIINQCSQNTVRGLIYQVSQRLDPEILDKLEPLDKFTHEGKEYVGSNLSDATYGEWTDCEDELNHLEEGNIDRLPYLIGIMFRPEGEEYSWKNARMRARSFKELPITTAIRLRAFFLSQGLQLLTDSQTYSQEKKLKTTSSQQQQDSENSKRNGVLSWLSSLYQKIIINLKRFLGVKK